MLIVHLLTQFLPVHPRKLKDYHLRIDIESEGFMMAILQNFIELQHLI